MLLHGSRKMWTCGKCSYAYNRLWSESCEMCETQAKQQQLQQQQQSESGECGYSHPKVYVIHDYPFCFINS